MQNISIQQSTNHDVSQIKQVNNPAGLNQQDVNFFAVVYMYLSEFTDNGQKTVEITARGLTNGAAAQERLVDASHQLHYVALDPTQFNTTVWKPMSFWDQVKALFSGKGTSYHLSHRGTNMTDYSAHKFDNPTTIQDTAYLEQISSENEIVQSAKGTVDQEFGQSRQKDQVGETRLNTAMELVQTSNQEASNLNLLEAAMAEQISKI